MKKSFSNPTLPNYIFLEGMYRDGYVPNHLVDTVRQVLFDLCVEIEASQCLTLQGLYTRSERATERINDLQEAFYAADSELETVAREVMAENFAVIAKAYGFNADRETLVGARDW